MPSSDYTSAVRGGLKLKGTSSGGIDKKKSKKKKKAPLPETELQALTDNDANPTEPATADDTNDAALEKALKEEDSASKSEPRARDTAPAREDGKTEAERKFEERRRKRLDERLRREGVQTHKERVEKLNKYLSGLSEHHDMPRIGPG